MPKQPGLLPGTLDLLVLKAVSLEPQHGYGVLLRIEQITGGALTIEQGTLYPALHRLEHRGLLACEWGTSDNNRRARYYRLYGRRPKTTRDETESWNRLVTAIRRRAKDPPGGVVRWRPVCDPSFESVFRRTAGEEELNDEIQFHIEQRAKDVQRSGVPPTQAVRQARLEFGGTERWRESCRGGPRRALAGRVGAECHLRGTLDAQKPRLHRCGRALALALGVGETRRFPVPA